MDRPRLFRVKVFFALAAAVALMGRGAVAFAVTADDLKPALFEALGVTAGAYKTSAFSGDLTRRDATRLCLEIMGWDFAIKAVDQIGILPEWPEVEGVSYIAGSMSPAPPQSALDEPDALVSSGDAEAFVSWLKECGKDVRWKASFEWEGTELILIKRGAGNPTGSANGDLEHGANEPFFAALLAADMRDTPCQIATAVMVGANKAPLATIAGENYGVIGGVNGGYFANAKPIGVLRRQGYTDAAKFWPNRSAFGWNERGDFIFIDGKETKSISSSPEFDEYTEMLQAGPLLLKNGEIVANTENVQQNVLEKRHPRTFVGTDGRRVFWGVVDGRDNMHSVGATIEELRRFCVGLSLSDALNLDGGGSSSLWWRGMTFTLPSNASDRERPIPYAILMFEEGMGVRQ